VAAPQHAGAHALRGRLRQCEAVERGSAKIVTSGALMVVPFMLTGDAALVFARAQHHVVAVLGEVTAGSGSCRRESVAVLWRGRCGPSWRKVDLGIWHRHERQRAASPPPLARQPDPPTVGGRS
jgi:hypothetical protein